MFTLSKTNPACHCATSKCFNILHKSLQSDALFYKRNTRPSLWISLLRQIERCQSLLCRVYDLEGYQIPAHQTICHFTAPLRCVNEVDQHGRWTSSRIFHWHTVKWIVWQNLFTYLQNGCFLSFVVNWHGRDVAIFFFYNSFRYLFIKEFIVLPQIRGSTTEL